MLRKEVFVIFQIRCSRKVVITGGPCSGKTSLIERISEFGYTVVEEAATQIISKGIYHPQKEPLKFQRHVLSRQIFLEKKAESETDGLIFCDRGIYDGLAYLRFFNVPEDKLELPERWNYLMAFHLEQLEYKKDEIRFETPKEAHKISELIREVYIEKGIPVEHVPVMNISQRTNFVLNRVKVIE